MDQKNQEARKAVEECAARLEDIFPELQGKGVEQELHAALEELLDSVHSEEEYERERYKGEEPE